MSKLIVKANSGKTVNLRRQPSKSAEVIKAINVGNEVTLIERTSSDWYKVSYGAYEGYMMAQFLQASSKISQEDLREVYNSLKDTLVLIEKILK